MKALMYIVKIKELNGAKYKTFFDFRKACQYGLKNSKESFTILYQKRTNNWIKKMTQLKILNQLIEKYLLKEVEEYLTSEKRDNAQANALREYNLTYNWKMKLEVGKKYNTRNGDVTTVTKRYDCENYLCDNGVIYRSSGRFNDRENQESNIDLISEIT